MVLDNFGATMTPICGQMNAVFLQAVSKEPTILAECSVSVDECSTKKPANNFSGRIELPNKLIGVII